MFDDFVDTLKGAGVIGTFLGVFVLFSMIMLFVLVFDPRLADWVESDARVVAKQDREIQSLEHRLGTLREAQREHQHRKSDMLQLLKLRRSNEQAGESLQELAGRIESAKARNHELTDEFNRHVASHREKLRAAAKGESLKVLVTSEGKQFDDVVILEVNPAGLQIRHRNGTARVLFVSLPQSFRDRFHFDEDEMIAFVENERRLVGEQEEQLARAVEAAKARQRELRIEFAESRILWLEQRISRQGKRTEFKDRWGLTERGMSYGFELQRLRTELEWLLEEEEKQQTESGRSPERTKRGR